MPLHQMTIHELRTMYNLGDNIGYDGPCNNACTTASDFSDTESETSSVSSVSSSSPFDSTPSWAGISAEAYLQLLNSQPSQKDRRLIASDKPEATVTRSPRPRSGS